MGIDIILLITQVLTLVVLIFHVKILMRTLKADHERKRKQSSIEILGHEYRQCRYELESKFGSRYLTKKDIEKITNNIEYEAIIVQLLGILEHISVGVNSGVYDRDIVYRMSATSMILIYKRLEPYISYRQMNINTNSYIEFQYMINTFESMKVIKPTKNGNIKAI